MYFLTFFLNKDLLHFKGFVLVFELDVHEFCRKRYFDDKFATAPEGDRSFFVNEKLKEITFHLFPEHHIFTNVHSIFFDEPSRFSFQALEPVIVCLGDPMRVRWDATRYE